MCSCPKCQHATCANRRTWEVAGHEVVALPVQAATAETALGMWEGICCQPRTLKRTHPPRLSFSFSSSSLFTLPSCHATLHTQHHNDNDTLTLLFSCLVPPPLLSLRSYLRRLLCVFPAAAYYCTHSVDHPSAQPSPLQLRWCQSKVGTPKKPFRGDTSGEAPGRDRAAFDSYGPLGVLLGVGLFFVFLRILLSLPS